MIKIPSIRHMITTKENPLRSKFDKGILSLFLIISMAVPFAPSAYAATTPSLGAASTYAVLGSTFTNTTAGTTINGDVGFTTGPAVTPAGIHINYGPGAPYAVAGSNQSTALSSLASEPCTFTFTTGAIDLSTDTTHGPVGVYAPGVYCSTGAMDVGGPLILSGNGTFIFRPGGALTSTAGALVSLNGASACNVFWTPTQATTLAANTTFVGTVIDDAGITVGANTQWIGRALAFGGTVTTDTVTITTCSAVPVASSSVSSSSVTSSSSAPMTSSSSSHVSSFQSSSVRSSSSSSMAPSSSSASSARSSARPVFVPRVIQSVAPTPPPPPTPAVPLMPNTGVGPNATSFPWEIFVFGFLMPLAFLFSFHQAKRLLFRN